MSGRLDRLDLTDAATLLVASIDAFLDGDSVTAEVEALIENVDQPRLLLEMTALAAVIGRRYYGDYPTLREVLSAEIFKTLTRNVGPRET